MEIKNFLKAIMLIGIAGSLMGNKGCEDKPEGPRTLLRRVQMGVMEAPQMSLPNGQVFDFRFAANAQLYYVLKTTQSFSSASIGSSDELDPAKMDEIEKEMFYQCHDTEGLSAMSMSQTAACMIRMPQARIDGAIESFELENSIGLKVGLPKFANLGVSTDIKKSVLTMDFQANHPLIENFNIAASRPTAKRMEFDVGAEVNFGEFSLGAKYYYSSPLAKVLNKAMKQGISELKTQIDAAEKGEWYAMVMKNCDQDLLINAGGAADANLVVGDQLVVYNVLYDWEGAACDSELRGSMKASTEPIALVEIELVGDTFSKAKIISQTGASIRPGARAYLHKLYTPPTTTTTKKPKSKHEDSNDD